MTASETKTHPDFFEEHTLDPVTTAARTTAARTSAKGAHTAVPKKKAGFYLPAELLTRFDRQFHQLKIDGVPVENKSALLELVLEYALADLEREGRSVLLRKLEEGR
jgi:hypothetical protein